jgi:hypothetical protein
VVCETRFYVAEVLTGDGPMMEYSLRSEMIDQMTSGRGILARAAAGRERDESIEMADVCVPKSMWHVGQRVATDLELRLSSFLRLFTPFAEHTETGTHFGMAGD